MEILNKKDLNLTPIFIVASTGLQIILLLLVFILTARVGKLANSKIPTLVELNDGTSARVAPIGHNDRTPQVITDFVARTITGLMSWNAVSLVTDSYEKKNSQLDPGVEARDKKMTTGTWSAGFALSEDFRKPFLEELAQLTPPDVFSGKTQSTLIVRHLSEPEKISEGAWKLDMVANLVIFEDSNQVGKAISFNKTIFIRAVDTPPLASNASDLQRTIYRVRQAGLEIFKIQDLGLGR